MGASLFTLFFNQGVDAGVLDDRHRPHAVLPQLRGHDGQGPDRGAWTGRSRTRRWTSGRRRSRTFWKITFPRILPGVVGRLPAVAGAVDRRLHHHVVRGRPDGDVPPAGVRLGPHRPAAAGPRAGDDDHARRHRHHRHRHDRRQPPGVARRRLSDPTGWRGGNPAVLRRDGTPIGALIRCASACDRRCRRPLSLRCPHVLSERPFGHRHPTRTVQPTRD